jgi:UDP-glucose 4-epimerase
MPTYLVTGGCGFIGSHLVDALVAAGHRVHVIDDLSTGRIENLRPEALLTVGDVADAEFVARAMRQVDGCFHLAAVASTQRSNEAWLATHRTNLQGTIAVLDAARSRRLPVVYASSAAVYGHGASAPIRETAALHPITAYGADKLGSELHARVGGLVHGVPTLGLRFFNVYGPRQDASSPYSGVISIFVDRLLGGKAIDVYGDGHQVRDFIYVEDVVRFLIAGMQRASEQAPVLNACTGAATSIVHLARVIGRLCGGAGAGAQVDMRFLPARAGDIGRSVGAPGMAAEILGIQAKVSLADGLARTIRAITEERTATAAAAASAGGDPRAEAA